MDPMVVAGVVGGAVLLIGLLSMTVIADRADVRDSLRRLEGYQIPDVRDQEMLAPISERVFNPVLTGLASIARALHTARLPRADRGASSCSRAARPT